MVVGCLGVMNSKKRIVYLSAVLRKSFKKTFDGLGGLNKTLAGGGGDVCENYTSKQQPTKTL